MNSQNLIIPNWPVPNNVFACVTTRHGGKSKSPYDHCNLATHVGDDFTVVSNNRNIILTQLELLEQQACWLNQVHGTKVVELKKNNQRTIEADGCYTSEFNTPCIVLTADCLPIMLCDTQGQWVAALHAGWRGLAGGIIEQAIQQCTLPTDTLLAWLGPAISQVVYEVGEDVRETFIKQNVQLATAFIKSSSVGLWKCDLYALAKIKLKQQGVHQIYGGDHCTYSEKDTFYSYRREGALSGRMASIIWINPDQPQC